MSSLALLLLLPLLPELPLAPPEEGGEAESTEPADEAEPRGRARARAPYLGADIALASTYVFRGEAQYGSPVIPSLQPSLWLDFSSLVPGSLELNLWSAFALADRERVRREATATELDLGLLYEQSVAGGWLEVGGGFLYYIYPGEEQVDGEKELVLSLNVGNLPLSLGVTTYLEVHPGLGVTFEPALGWEREFGSFSVEVELLLGASVYRDAGGSIDHVTFQAGVSHDVGRLTFGLGLAYALRIAPPGLDFLERSLLYGAVDISFNPPE